VERNKTGRRPAIPALAAEGAIGVKHCMDAGEMAKHMGKKNGKLASGGKDLVEKGKKSLPPWLKKKGK
jgi:hypothetical protein